MSLLTDFVIADLEEAPSVALVSRPATRWRGVESKGIDLIVLATLLLILSKEAIEDKRVLETVEKFTELAARDLDDGPWVYLVPDALVSGLSNIPDTALDAVARA